MAYNLPSSFSKHERPPHHDRQSSRSDSSISSSSSDDEETVALRRQLKMKKRKYKLQVARWEEREEKRLHHYKREARISAERVPEKEVEYLRKFLAKYRDEEDDSRWFEGRELKRRRRAFESEKRYDEEDRQAEAKELKAVNRLVLDKTTIKSESRTPEGCKQSKKDEEKLEDPKKIGAESSLSQTKTASYAQVFEGSTVFQPTLPKKIAVSIDVKTALKSKAAQVFNTADEEEVDLLRTRKTLKPFEITKEDRAAHITPEERSKMFKDILQKTPTDKKELFATSVDRTQMDEHFLDNRMRPWVMKRLSEYIGEEENSFCDYICDKIAKESDPYKLLTDVSLILDEDAETFMIKLWRKIVFETECKRLGVVPSPLD